MTEEDVDILSKEVSFSGFFKLVTWRLRHRRFDGGWTGEIRREVFERGHAVGVLLYDPARDEVALVEQFRVGALAAGMAPWLLEVVAGMIDDGETPAEVAHRETVEEAGQPPLELVRMLRYLVSPGGTSETVELFCARVDTATMGGLFGIEDEGEDIRVRVLPADEAIGMLSDGHIDNSATVIALQWLALNRDMLRLRWR
ncbi:MAG: NUDIX domain-containing protein [Alphaproteobacteria bacterium]|nr:NUDIX domain-containing protein [Alphaproteobacteria bacterium]